MRFPGVGSTRIAQLALAMLLSAALAACHDSSSSTAASGSATASSASTSSVGIAGGTSTTSTTATTSTPTDKSVTLSWSQPTENSNGTSLTDLAGYTLHYGTSSQDYTGSIQITSATQTSYVVSGSSFPPGTYYFAISAYNAEQVSSSLSSEITIIVD